MRVENWESMLADYISQAVGRPFAWGEHDCALWAGRWVDIATGTSHVSDWTGKYNTRNGADSLMMQSGYESVEDIANKHLKAISVTIAKRGDLVLFHGALGICEGRRSYVITDEKGIVAIPTLKCSRAWSV